MNEIIKDKPKKWTIPAFDIGKVKKTGQSGVPTAEVNNKTSIIKENPTVNTVNNDPVLNKPADQEQPGGSIGMGDLKQAEANDPGNVDFFDQKPPRNMNELYIQQPDKTKAPVYDYKKLDNLPITKKVYKERIHDPENRQPTFPLSIPEETNTGSISSKDIAPELSAAEETERTTIINKINNGEINLPPFVQHLPENEQLSYVGATYNNNPVYSFLTTLIDPLLHLENLGRTGVNKVTGSDFKMLQIPNLSAEDEDSKLITGGVDILTSLIPLGASIQGANYLFKGLKNPFLKKMLSTGVGFMINTQPELLDNLTQNNIELKDYAIQSAKDFATGITFGALPKGTPLKIEIPYQSIVPTMVPVVSDLLQGKEVNENEIVHGFISNMVLGLVMSGNLPKYTKVNEVTKKVKSELSKYAEEQHTPELVNNIIAGLLPPARVENIRTVTNIKPGEITTETKQPSKLGKLFGQKEKTIETETKPVLEEISFPVDKSKIIVDEKGNARIEPESDYQEYTSPVKMTKEKYEDMKNNGMTDAEIKAAQENINTRNSETGIVKPDPESVNKLRDKISKGEANFTAEEIQIFKHLAKENNIEQKKGVILSADPKAEIEIKNEENRINADLKNKYNKEIIPEIENPVLLNTLSERVKDKVQSYNEAIREHNKQFEVNEPVNKIDGRKEQLNDIKQRINEALEESKSTKSKNESRKLIDRIEKLQEQRNFLEKTLKNEADNSINDNLPGKEKQNEFPKEDPFSNKKNVFEKMTLSQMENHIESQVKEFGSRVDYMQSAEYKEIIKPAYDKLVKARESKVMDEVNIAKNDYKNKIISQEQYNAAIKSIKERGNNLHSNPLDVGAIRDLGIAGLYHFERGLSKLGDWAKRMVKEFGNWVKPHLKKIWTEINDPKVMREFRERYPNAKMHTSGIGLKNPKETYEQYATRIVKEFKKVPTKEEYNKRKNEPEEIKDQIGNSVNTSETKQTPEVRKTSDPETKKVSDQELTENVSKESNRSVNKSNNTPVKRGSVKTSNEIYTKKVQDKINEIGKELTEKGYEGAEFFDKSKAEVRKAIFGKDPEIKKLSADKKRAINKIIDDHFKQEYRKFSGYDNLLGSEYRETFLKDKVFRKGIKQSLNIVREMGKPGKEFAERMEKMADDEQAWMGEVNGRILDISELNKAERNNLEQIFKAKMFERTPPNYISENVKNVDLKIDKYFDDIAKEFEKRGFLTKDKNSNDIRLFSPRKDYRPQITKLEKDNLGVQYDIHGKPIHNIQREKVLKHLVDTKQAKDKANAAEMLDNNIAGNRVHKAGNIEYSRTIEFPEEYYITNPGAALVKYGESVSKRLAFADAWGMNKDIADRLIDDIKKGNMNYRFAKRLFKFETGDLTYNEKKSLEGINSIKAFMIVTKFTPFTALRNGFQGFLGTTTGGNLKAGITGLLKSLLPAMRREAYESGTLGQSMTKIVKESISGNGDNIFGKMADIYLDKVIFFTTLERANRIVSSIGGLSFMEDMLKRIKTNSVFKKRAYREFERYGLDPDEVIKRGEFTDQEKKMIMRKFTNYTEFRTRPQDLPLYWSHPTGKLLTQWKPFSYKMTQLIRDGIYKELKHGNIMPLVTMLTAYGVAGETINFIIDNIRSVASFNPKQDDPENKTPIEKTAVYKLSEGDIGGFLDRYIDDVSALGALTFYYDIARSYGYGKDSKGVSVLLGPAVAEITQSLAQTIGPPLKYATGGRFFTDIFRGSADDFDKTVKTTLLGLYQTAGRNTPGAGIPRTLGITKAGQDWLFGKEQSIKSKFRDTLNSNEKNELDEIDNLEKQRDKAKEKALKTGDKGDFKKYDALENELEKKRDKSRAYYNLNKFKQNKIQSDKDKLNKR